jgi:hypothetical protein
MFDGYSDLVFFTISITYLELGNTRCSLLVTALVLSVHYNVDEHR